MGNVVFFKLCHDLRLFVKCNHTIPEVKTEFESE